jgi:hypothetical protein
LKGNAHQKIDNVEGGKQQKHLVECPLTNSINMKEDGLEEKEEKAYTDYFACDHHEKMGAVGHLPHQSDLYEQKKQF